MDWKITAGLILTLFTFAMGTYLARNSEEAVNIHAWIDKIENRSIENSEDIVRMMGDMKLHRMGEHSE
jgi:activator of 2-hydroxyglutaryl-CoA dehydratase